MKLSDLVKHISGAKVIRDAEIKGIAYDSRDVKKGYVFVAVAGVKTDGHAFLKKAAENGAAAVIVQDPSFAFEPGVGLAQVPDSRSALSEAAKVFYGDPSAHLLTAGVTGTKGKTTTCHFIRQVLEASGEKCGLLGTVHNIIGDEIRPSKLTTPESSDLQAMLRDMLTAGCTSAVMEVSSHALSMGRTEHIRFDAAVLTNIGRDHLDFHKTVDSYVEAKTKLFSQLCKGDVISGKERRFPRVAVVNAHDPYKDRFLAHTQHKDVRVVSYGLSEDATLSAQNIRYDSKGTTFELCAPTKKQTVRISTPGNFNVLNALAAAGVAYGLGFSWEGIVQGLESAAGVKGRLQVIPEITRFSVWVDYAHTPESLEDVLLAAKEMCQGRVIVVFGCGGDRDSGKRPIMGEVAARLSDFAVITNDNPRTENENIILDDIEKGLVEAGARVKDKYIRVPDRRKAIEAAIGAATPGDIVIIAGKGHETYQMFKDKTIHFDDAQEARKAFETIFAK